LRGEDGEGAAIAELGAFQQALRGSGRFGLRERSRAASGGTVPTISTIRAIDLWYLKRWAASRRKPALRQMGIDEIYLGKKHKFLTVVSNLESGEPLWFGRKRKKETLDEFLGEQLSAFQRSVVRAACVDMWEPFRQSLGHWVPKCQIIYDKFQILQHASKAGR
jgi:transposase